jgi:hypothetical protein
LLISVKLLATPRSMIFDVLGDIGLVKYGVALRFIVNLSSVLFLLKFNNNSFAVVLGQPRNHFLPNDRRNHTKANGFSHVGLQLRKS